MVAETEIEPTGLVKDLLSYLRHGTVLDAGTGKGHNAIFLAKQGFEVTAIDISPQVLVDLDCLADDHGCRIKTELADILAIDPSIQYDVVFAYGLLHCLPDKQSALDAVKVMQEATNSNGFNIILDFTDRVAKIPGPTITPPLFTSGELRNLYEQWGILSYEENEHGIAKLLARKN